MNDVKVGYSKVTYIYLTVTLVFVTYKILQHQVIIFILLDLRTVL